MELFRFEQEWSLCRDPDCRWAGDPDHLSRHNPPCGLLFIGTDSSEWMCTLVAGHDGPHRGGQVR